MAADTILILATCYYKTSDSTLHPEDNSRKFGRELIVYIGYVCHIQGERIMVLTKPRYHCWYEHPESKGRERIRVLGLLEAHGQERGNSQLQETG